ncbi:hypothetical protein [Sphingomonas kyeonggiensis]|uniref:Uncharacterized protein n=1 Tax=Sphingomonas kyeonggiensis TaxID=1268553 RepID=A0A7W6JNZ5_9SPHN|nr:hypothetical protein [Sphingomonas kyeonggiensis]MBB4096808.1 hypothetical protein [Sphingomonas kyeonggiensis]
MKIDAAGTEDPKAFLSALGIEIDAATEAVLQKKLASATNGQQAAAIVHFDG